jgi:hypothetical protein
MLALARCPDEIGFGRIFFTIGRSRNQLALNVHGIGLFTLPMLKPGLPSNDFDLLP